MDCPETIIVQTPHTAAAAAAAAAAVA